jgi:hypothetical protein
MAKALRLQERKPKMTNITKLKSLVPQLADQSIESNDTVQALDKARFDYESRMHDLNSMIARRNKLRADCLAGIVEIGGVA